MSRATALYGAVKMCSARGMLARRLSLAAMLAAAAAAGLAPRFALAQDGGAASGSLPTDVPALEDALSRQATQLSADCPVACSALASMSRLAERICALEPGPRCAAARAKVQAATARVTGACGACATAEHDAPLRAKNAEEALRAPAQPASAPAPTPTPTPTPTPEGPTVVQAAPPPRGGCAGCSASGGDGGLGASALAALSTVALLLPFLRRRRRRDQR